MSLYKELFKGSVFKKLFVKLFFRREAEEKDRKEKELMEALLKERQVNLNTRVHFIKERHEKWTFGMSFKSPLLRGKPQTTGKPVEGIGTLLCHSPTYHMSVGSPLLRGKPQTIGEPVEGGGTFVSLPDLPHVSGKVTESNQVTWCLPHIKPLSLGQRS